MVFEGWRLGRHPSSERFLGEGYLTNCASNGNFKECPVMSADLSLTLEQIYFIGEVGKLVLCTHKIGGNFTLPKGDAPLLASTTAESGGVRVRVSDSMYPILVLFV